MSIITIISENTLEELIIQIHDRCFFIFWFKSLSKLQKQQDSYVCTNELYVCVGTDTHTGYYYILCEVLL